MKAATGRPAPTNVTVETPEATVVTGKATGTWGPWEGTARGEVSEADSHWIDKVCLEHYLLIMRALRIG